MKYTEKINKFKKYYLESKYLPNKQAPSWLKELGKISGNHLGVLALLGSTGINISSPSGRIKLEPDALSLHIAGLTGCITTMKAKVSVGLPPFARDLSLFLACISVLNNLMKKASNQNEQYGGVLVVSPDIRIRSQYCDLYIKNQSLESAYPGSRLLPTGKLQALTNTKNKFAGVCFFLPHRQILPENISINPDLIILDFRYARLNSKICELIQWTKKIKTAPGILALYTLGDRQSRTVLQESNYLDLPLDHLGISTCENYLSLKKSDIKTSYLNIGLMGAVDALNRKHELKAIPLSSGLQKVLSKLAKLFDEHSKNNHPELNRIRWLFSVYSHMPVPLVWYENAARERGRWVPKNVISRIGSNSSDIENLGPVLETFQILFENLNQLYEQANPKANEIKKSIQLVSGKLSEKNRLLILVRDEIMENSLSSWLSLSDFMGKDKLSYIDIVCCKNYIKHSDQNYSYFISTGSLHYKYRWILGGDVGHSLQFYIYPHELKITQKQIEQFYDCKYIDNRSRRRFQTKNKIGPLKVKKN